MNVKNALELANKEFISAKIDNCFYETRELLSFTLGKSKEWIMSNLDYEIPENDYNNFLKLKKERIDGTPFQYILGEQYFMGIKFLVNSDVLIPRADTEILVYKVIDMVKNKGNIKILDMCTGSGCIAVSLAKELKNAKVFGADISDKAIIVAKKNSELNETNVKFYKSNLFESVPKEKFDVIVSNPPYISGKEMEVLSKDVLMEPRIALFGGEDGLEFYRGISKKALEYLKDFGVIAFEIGYNQASSVSDILESLGYREIETIKDYSGNDRVLVARK